MPTTDNANTGDTGKVSLKHGLADPNRAGPHQGSSMQEVRKGVMCSMFSSNGVAHLPPWPVLSVEGAKVGYGQRARHSLRFSDTGRHRHI